MIFQRFIRRIKTTAAVLLVLILSAMSVLSIACKDDPIGPVLTDQDENSESDKDGAGD